MKTQKKSKPEVVVWKYKFVPLVGGATQQKLAETKEGLKKEKKELKSELTILERQHDRRRDEIEDLMNTRYNGTGLSRKEVCDHHLGKDVFETEQSKIAETKKALEGIDGEMLALEKREQVLVARRKEKEQKLTKVKEATKKTDERMNRDFENQGHITGITHAEREEDWLRQNLSEKEQADYKLKKQLEKKYEEALKKPEVEEPPPPKRTMSEEEKLRAAWRKAEAAFQPHKKFAERAREGPGKAIEEKYGQAVEKAEEKEYEEAIKLLKEAKRLVDEAKKKLEKEKKEIANATKEDAEKQKEAFNFTTEVKDQEWGFDTDDDAKNFYLANSVNALGGLETSPQLKQMQEVYEDCLKRRDQLKKMGASIDEIVEAVYKNVPKNFWPDDVVKEVILYKTVKEQIEAEERLAQSELDLEGVMEKVEEGPGFIGEQSTEAWEYSLMADQIKEKFPEAEDLKTSEITDALSHFSDICSALSDTTMGFLKMTSALESQGELEEAEENPVKAKIVEFQRNKAIIECANSLVSAGLDVAGEAVLAEAVPILGVITGTKNALTDIAGAVTYFKNLAYINTLKKGAAIDPRTAALLPLARQAREQKIAASDKLVSAVSNILKTLGKSAELGAMTAPAGIAVNVAGAIVSYGGKVVIEGIKWGDAAAAVKSIKLAVGPPPNRKAQFEVLKNSTKFARAALAQLARDGDPWAIGHLGNMGLEREDINNKATTNKLLREYMALMSGGTFADGVGEEQQTFGETKGARAAKYIGRGIVKGAEMIRDLIVGRDTGIPYDPSWRMDAAKAPFTPDAWQKVRGEAINAGWYDSRPALDADLAAFQQARIAYEGNLNKKLEGKALNKAIDDASAVIEAVVAIGNRIRGIKAVANDRATPHAGVTAFLNGWYQKTQTEPKKYIFARSAWIDRLAFPGKEGEALKKAKEEFMGKSETEAREKQSEKAEKVRKQVDKLWESHKIPGPFGAATIKDFTDKAVKALGLDETAAKDLRTEVGDLWDVFHERLSQEVMASPDDKEVEKRFKLSVQTVDPMAVEALRAASERVYKEMLNRTGATDGEDGWTPSGGDIVLTKDSWENVKKAAERKGWKKGGDTGLTPALKNYGDAFGAFDKERNNSPQNRTTLEQAQGVLLGSIDKLVTALEDFQPLTDKQFNHPGLSAWRDGMVEECASARVEYGAPLFD